jgi:hypothetical protein
MKASASANEARVAAELALVTTAALDDDTLSRVGPAILRAAMEIAAPPPVGILADVVHVLLDPAVRLDLARARALRELPTDDAELSAAVGAAFDSFVVPVATSLATRDIRDALARHDSEVAALAAGALAAEIIGRCAQSSAVEGEALRLAAVRKTLGRPAREVLSKGAIALADPSRREALKAAYGAIATAARRSGALVGPSDVIVAEGAAHLANRATRIALRQIADASAEIARRVPSSIVVKRSRGADAATRQRDESTYPMGGFASMSNAGSLENVVSSELALSSDGDIGEDLFAIRWAIGELLYYTRDESVAMRRRARVWLVLDPDLRGARVKDREAPFQRLVLALGAIGVVVERTLHLLRQEALEVRVVMPEPPDLDEEHALLALSLARSVATGHVEVVRFDPSGLRARIEEDRRDADVLAVRFSCEGAPRAEEDAAVRIAAEATIERSARGRPIEAPRKANTAVEAWAEICKALLSSLP